MRDVCRPMRRLFLLVLLAVSVTNGQTPPLTTISDTVYRADGLRAQGTLLISWPEFTTSGGQAVVAGTDSVTLGTGGALSVALVPNVNATPTNTVYVAVYQLDDGTVKTEFWIVPTASPATLAEVRTTLGASENTALFATQQFVTSAVATKANDTAVVHLTGGETITGTKQFSVAPNLPNPVHPGDAANKQYVDNAVQNAGSGNYLSLAGGTMTGALTLSGDPTAPNQAATKHYSDLWGAVKADLIAGLVPPTELGSGTPNSATCLLGNQSWGPCSTGGSGSVYVNSALVANPNFNTATPGPQSNFLNCTFQGGTGTVSLECPYGSGSSSFALGSQAALNNQGNAFSTGLQDFSTARLKLPSGAGFTPATNGEIGLDTTANLPVIAISGTTQQIALTTSNISGQASTALALAGTPAQCSGSFATGIQANGNANCSVADVVELAETTPPSGIPNYGVFWFDSATHTPRVIDNNGQAVQLGLTNVFNSNANTLEEYNGTSAQTFNLYGTRTDASNYERLRLGYDSTDAYFFVGADAAGTGTQRGLGFLMQGSLRWAIDSSFNLKPWSDNLKDVGSPTLRVHNLYVGTGVVFGSGPLTGVNGTTGTALEAATVGTTAGAAFCNDGNGNATDSGCPTGGTVNGQAISPAWVSGRYFIDGTTNTSPQSIFANTGYRGGTIDWFPASGSTVNLPQTAAGVFTNPFANTASIGTPTVTIYASGNSHCSGVTYYLTASQSLTVVQAEWDAADNLVWSGTTTVAVGTGTNCYAVSDVPLIAGGAKFSTGAQECASACNPFVPTIQMTTSGQTALNPISGSTTHTYNYTTAANGTAGICPNPPDTQPNSQGGCIEFGQLLPPPNVGLLAPNTELNLGAATFSGCFINIPGSSHVHMMNRKASVLQRNPGCPNGIPYFNLWGRLIAGGGGTAGNVVSVVAAMLENGGPNAGDVISLSPAITSGAFTASYSQFQVATPGPPHLHSPWVGGVYWYPGQRIVVSTTNSNGAVIYHVSTPGKSQGTLDATAIPSGLQTSFNGCLSSCTVTDGGVTWTADFNAPPWQASHAYTAPAEIWDGTNLELLYTAGTSGSSAPAWSTKFAQRTTDSGAVWINIGPYNSIIEPSLQWYAAGCASSNPQCNPSVALAANGSATYQFSSCSLPATDPAGGSCAHANAASFSGTGSGSALPSSVTAVLTDAGSCPNGFSCNTSNAVYYGKYVFATPTGPSTPFNEGQTSGAVTAGDAITFSHPTNYPPDASGWLPEINTVSQSEILQPIDGLQVYCGDGTPGEYVWNLPNGAMCGLGADAHIISVQTLQPQPLRFGASNVLVTVGGQTALQNEAANGQYDAGIEGGTVECGPNGLSSIEPYSVGILNLVAEEQSGPFFMTVDDCAGVGIYEATPGAQNGSFYDNHIAGANADYSIGVVVEDVPAFREVNNLSVGSIQGTQWFDVAGVYFLANPLTDLGQDTTSIRNIESEAVMDVVKVDSAQAHLDHIEMTSTVNRVAVNVAHFGFNRNNPVAEASRAKSGACAIQDDAMGPTCTSGSNKTPGIYSPQQTTQALNGSSYNTQVVGLSDVSGGVDYVNVTGAATGNPATVAVGASGTDANVNLSLTAQGTGKVEAPTPSTADSSSAVATTAYVQAQGYVPNTTTVNGHALSGNVTVNASDLTAGSLPHAQLPSLLSGDIPNNAANTTGTAANLSGTPALPNGTTGTTQSPGDSTAKLATDAFVNQYVSAFIEMGNSVSNNVTVGDNATHGNLFGFTLPAAVTTGHITVYIGTADNSSNTYDIGIYQGTAGGTDNLLLHIGSTAGNAINGGATGYVTLAWTTSTTLPPGRYYLALFGNEASPALQLGGYSAPTFVHNSAFAITPASGSLPSTIVAPSDTWSAPNQPWVVLN